jgi:putative proteasome-type protease
VQDSAKPMTYCCGILVRAGLVMVADTRTNAGLDNVSTFRKLHIYTQPGERIMAIASSGNLSLSQSVRATLTEGVENPETGEVETLMNAPTMFQAAQRIGRTVRNVQSMEGKALEAAEVEHEVAFLFGGQIKDGPMRLYMIYSAGNFIECTTDTPYLQIGEHKYGKPVLDRAIGFDTDLYDSLKIGLISMDSTMRSNLGVGLPIDILVVRRDACTAGSNRGNRISRTCASAGPALYGPRTSRYPVRPIAARPDSSAWYRFRHIFSGLEIVLEGLHFYRRLIEPRELPVPYTLP